MIEHDDHQLYQRADSALRNSPHLPKRTVRLEAAEGRVTLRGSVRTYFQKQMAQESLRHIEGLTAIHNEIDVTWAEAGA